MSQSFNLFLLLNLKLRNLCCFRIYCFFFFFCDNEKISLRDTCIFVGIAVEVQERPILLSTHPTLPKNIVATNFTNLQLIVSINHTFDTICQWLITSAISFSNIFFENHCLEERPNDNYRSTCETTDIIITYNLTFLLPIRTTLDFFVGCYLINDPIEMRNTITIFVQGKKTLRIKF